MRVLIVEQNRDLAALWKGHLDRLGAEVDMLHSVNAAEEAVNSTNYNAVVLDLAEAQAGCFELADVIAYRWPDTRIVFVTGSTFFSDGSLFGYVSNAAAMVPREAPPEDLAAVVEHHAMRS